MEAVKNNVWFSLQIVAVLWGIYIIDALLPYRLTSFGIHPRSIFGLFGIIFAPFLHASVIHITANSFALFFLLSVALTYDRVRAFSAIGWIIVLGGLGTWFFGASGTHVGASGVIFGLIGYLLALFYYQKDVTSLVIAMLVLFMYGGSLIFSLIPMPGVSWTGHFFGLLAGVFAARKTSKA